MLNGILRFRIFLLERRIARLIARLRVCYQDEHAAYIAKVAAGAPEREATEESVDMSVHLRELLRSDPAYPDAFTYSILQILPRTAARAEVLRWERHYKEKLGSMATGLNAN